MFHQSRGHACALNGSLDGDTAQITGVQTGEIALECAHGSTGSTDDNDWIIHDGFLQKSEQVIDLSDEWVEK
jgi:hypothetical protein